MCSWGRSVVSSSGSTWAPPTVRAALSRWTAPPDTSDAGVPAARPLPGWQVQDPDVLVAATLAAVSACVADTAGAEVVALAVSSPRYGLIGLDATLSPVTPLLTGRDTRSAEVARDLRVSGQSRELHRVTGTPVHPRSPLCKLIWFARHEPYLCAATRWWIGLKDYLVHRLTGTLVTELSSASGTGMFDVHQSAVERRPHSTSSGCPRANCPRSCPRRRCCGCRPRPGRAVGLPSGTPVVVGAGDGPLRSLGAAAIDRTVGRPDARRHRGSADCRQGPPHSTRPKPSPVGR